MNIMMIAMSDFLFKDLMNIRINYQLPLNLVIFYSMIMTKCEIGFI